MRLLYLGACPNQAEEEQQFAMTTSEAVRLQLDNLQKENHELQVRILKLSQTKPDAKAITEIETERDHWKEKYEGVVIENSQLEALYEKLLESTKGTSPIACDEGPQSIFELQEQLHQEVEAAQQWKYKCEGLNQELIKWKSQCALWEVEENKLKPTKCSLAGTEVTYLGYMISWTGISADPQKVEAVQNFPPPDDLTSLRSFLGLASYYRRFVPGFSTIAGPLYLLLQKNTNFLWGQTQQESFDHLKQLLTCAPVLAFPDFDQEFILETDASGKGLGAILAY